MTIVALTDDKYGFVMTSSMFTSIEYVSFIKYRSLRIVDRIDLFKCARKQRFFSFSGVKFVHTISYVYMRA